MNPQIALIICLIFVIALLILDRKLFKSRSMAVWIPTVWMLYCASRPLGYWFASNNLVDNFVIAEGSPMDRIFLLVLISSGLLVLVRRKIDWGQVIIANRWLLFLFSYMLISILWSDYQFVSFKRWFKAFSTIVMALVVLTGQSPIKEFNTILRRVVYILIPFSILLIKYFPQLGVKWGRYTGATAWAGVATNKNSLGVLCMLSVMFLIWTFAKRWRKKEEPSANYEMIANVMILGMTFWLLKGPGGNYSATSVIAIIVGLTTLFMLRRMKTGNHVRTMAILAMFVTGTVCLLLWGLMSATPLSIIADLTGHDATLSGRTDQIWNQLIPIALEHPILGLGYGGFWLQPLEFDKLTVNQAHNGYLDIFIELGAVGLILFAIVIVMFFLKAADDFKYDIEWGSFRISFLLITLLYNYTESTHLKSTAMLWNVLVMLMVIYPKKQEKLLEK